MMNNSKSFSGKMVLVVAVAIGFTQYKLFQQQRSLRKQIESINEQAQEKEQTLQASVATQVDAGATVIEKIVSSSQVWRAVQDASQDTVVQIFSQIAATDILQPYKTPNQHTAYGSGFFINEDGYIITNAHVINQAKAIWMQVPSLGKRIMDLELVSISPDRDLALVRVKQDDLEYIRTALGRIPHLNLGDSDTVRRADEVMALGYPLGQQSLKSTTGVISGREGQFIQMSAPINPGNSGGPLLNAKGEVVGINTAIIADAQNIGYIIPINDLKVILNDMYTTALIRKPYLGVIFNNGTECLTEFLGNPAPGGCYVVEVMPNSTLAKAGIMRGDMLYEINGHPIDIYGEMTVPWSEDKISIIDYVSRLSIGQELAMTVYRNGTRKNMKVAFSQMELPPVRKIYPGYEELDYEVCAGMVIMPLTINHIQILGQNAPGLARFSEMSQTAPALVVTHMFPTSQVYRSRTIMVGSTLNDVNGIEVHTLADLRKALKQGDGKFLTVRVSDHVARASDNVFVTLPFAKVLEEELQLSRDFKYPISVTMQELLKESKQQSVVLAAQQPAAIANLKA